MAQPRALLLAAAVALADSASALQGSGSGSTDVLPACSETANATSLYSNAFSTQCYTATGFSLSNISAPLSSEHASSVCESYSCRGVYATVVQLALPSDCLLNNSIQLQTVLKELAPYCNGSGYTNDTGSGSYIVDHNDRVPSVPNPTTSRVYTTTGPSRMSGPTIATIVSGAVGALLAFVAIVVAVAWYKRQSLRDLRRRAYTDPLVESKTTPSTSRRFWSRPSSSISGKFGGAYTATTDASSEAGINVVPLHPLQSSAFHGDTLWSDQELLARHMRAEDIEDIRVIGSGGHGVVYLVRHRGRRLLASKRLVQDHVTRDKTRLLIAEIKLVAQLDHPCIVQFVGAAWTTESDLQALFEYMPNGDLCTYLAKTSQPDESETWDLRKIQIAMDVAEALVYVHSFAPPLVHRDLKSRNILLDDNMRAKLTDFGVSRFHSDDNTMTTGVGTSRWLAPEVMAGGGMYDQTCDIYAFGMVLSELDTHRLPFSELRMPSGYPMPEMTILQRVSQGQLQPSFRATCPESLKAIALRCVAFEPAKRPSAIEVSYALRTIAKKEFGLQR